MNTLNELLPILCFSFTLGLSLFFFLFGHKVKEGLFYRQGELWFSLGLALAGLFIYARIPSPFSTLYFLFWLWPIRAMGRMIYDYTQKKVEQNVHSLILFSGSIVTFALAYYEFQMIYALIPFGLSLIYVSIMTLSPGFKVVNSPAENILIKTQVFCLLLITLQAAIGLYFNEVSTLYVLQFFLLVFLALSSFSLTLLKSDLKIQDKLKRTISDKDHQLLATSDFSSQKALCAGLTHELSGPLTVLQARLNLAQRKNQFEFDLGTINSMTFQVERMIKAIQNVREIIHANQLEEGKVEIEGAVQSVLGLVSQRYANHGINLRVYGNVSGVIHGNKVLLEQAIMHILHNSFEAIEFLPEKWIEISMIVLDDKYKLIFKDSGHGIPKEIQELIMNPLFTTKAEKSLGMGLTTVKRIVQHHGGEFYYMNQKNTTFVMELPKYQEKNTGPVWEESIRLKSIDSDSSLRQ